MIVSILYIKNNQVIYVSFCLIKKDDRLIAFFYIIFYSVVYASHPDAIQYFFFLDPSFFKSSQSGEQSILSSNAHVMHMALNNRYKFFYTNSCEPCLYSLLIFGHWPKSIVFIFSPSFLNKRTLSVLYSFFSFFNAVDQSYFFCTLH